MQVVNEHQYTTIYVSQYAMDTTVSIFFTYQVQHEIPHLRTYTLCGILSTYCVFPDMFYGKMVFLQNKHALIRVSQLRQDGKVFITLQYGHVLPVCMLVEMLSC